MPLRNYTLTHSLTPLQHKVQLSLCHHCGNNEKALILPTPTPFWHLWFDGGDPWEILKNLRWQKTRGSTCLAICFSVVTPYANVTDRPTHLFPIARQASNRCLVSMHIRTTSLSNTEVIYYETCEYKIPVCPVSVYWAVVSQISSIQKSDGPVIPQTTTNVQCNSNNFTMNLMASIYQ